MRRIFTLILLTASAAVAFSQVRIATPRTELVLNAEKGREQQIQYFGCRLSDADVQVLEAAGVPNHNAYQPYGIWCSWESALEVTHADGNLSTVLKVDEVSTVEEPAAKVTRIKLKDTVYPLYVTVCYRAYQDVDMTAVSWRFALS